MNAARRDWQAVRFPTFACVRLQLDVIKQAPPANQIGFARVKPARDAPSTTTARWLAGSQSGSADDPQWARGCCCCCCQYNSNSLGQQFILLPELVSQLRRKWLEPPPIGLLPRGAPFAHSACVSLSSTQLALTQNPFGANLERLSFKVQLAPEPTTHPSRRLRRCCCRRRCRGGFRSVQGSRPAGLHRLSARAG